MADRRVELVWTGPEPEGAGTRDTAVVARELFTHATSSVLIAGYALSHARSLLEPLVNRMIQVPTLRVRLFLNVRRREGDKRARDTIAGEFARGLADYEWPGGQLPEAFYDPRSLDADPARRAVLHAKCILVDDRKALVTSANLTDAAHHRNLELGVLLDDVHLALAIRRQFDGLIASGDLLTLSSAQI
jgi:phosphatidylserine/phosphatidylglycerophosphate/cardiolipin synthase-like enzyme